MTQDWKTEFTNNYPQLFVKGDEWNWQPDIVNTIESLLKEERNAVLKRAWEYVVKASREECGSKEDFIKFVNEHE